VPAANRESVLIRGRIDAPLDADIRPNGDAGLDFAVRLGQYAYGAGVAIIGTGGIDLGGAGRREDTLEVSAGVEKPCGRVDNGGVGGGVLPSEGGASGVGHPLRHAVCR